MFTLWKVTSDSNKQNKKYLIYSNWLSDVLRLRCPKRCRLLIDCFTPAVTKLRRCGGPDWLSSSSDLWLDTLPAPVSASNPALEYWLPLCWALCPCVCWHKLEILNSSLKWMKLCMRWCRGKLFWFQSVCVFWFSLYREDKYSWLLHEQTCSLYDIHHSLLSTEHLGILKTSKI